MNKRIFIGLIVLVVIILITAVPIFFFFSAPIGGAVIAKNPCPFDCCPAENFQIKECPEGYDCKEYQCILTILTDTDGDGLGDSEESILGTDPRLYDSDGDTLSDYDEVEILETDPLSPNTDGDRYRDNEDTNPNTLNTARMEVKITNKDWDWNYDNLVVLVGSLELGRSLNPNMVIADVSAAVTASNKGNDYASYVDFDLVFEISDKTIYSEYISLGKFELGEVKIKDIQRELRIVDIPESLLETIATNTTNWNVKIKNLDYEKWD